MAKEPAELMDSVLKMEGVKCSAAVSKEDGSTIKASAGAPGNLGEVVAFIGSAAEVITSRVPPSINRRQTPRRSSPKSSQKTLFNSR